MLARLTPQYTFALSAAIAFVGVLLCLAVILQAPWFGFRLDVEPESVGVVIDVDDAAGEAGIRVGDRVVAFASPGEVPVALEPFSLISDPDRTGSFAGLQALFAHVAALYSVTRGPAAEVHLADGRKIVLQRSPRPFGSLPPLLWVMALGVVPFLVGAGVWSYRRQDPAGRLLLLAGASFMGIALSNLLYAYRQPSIDPTIFELGVYANRLSSLLFFFSYMAVFWVYPRRLGSIRVVQAGLVVFLLFFVNELTHTVSWPGNVFAFPVVLSLPVTIGLVVMQWRLSRHSPVDRAALQWFVLAMMTGMVLVTGLYFLPGLVGAPPMLPLEVAFAIGIVSYLGLIMAVVRYRLFQLGEWWLTAWLWLLGGTAVVGLDVALAYLLNVAPTYVIALSIFFVGWVYFPLRQWLWRRLFWHGQTPMDWVPKQLFESVVSAREADALGERWQALLTRLFQPLDVAASVEDLSAPVISDEGLRLYVPNLGGDGSVVLAYRSNGRRLFSPSDVELIASLLHMAGPAVDAQTARRVATRRERERIMRDLHDDVGARLLTLSHRLRDPDDVEKVRGAMQALRETIYSLNQPEGVDLESALADWHHEIVDRLEHDDIALEWKVSGEPANLRLSAGQRAHLGQVLREAVSNAMRHGQPSRLRLSFGLDGSRLRAEVGSDGRCEDPAKWQPGTGMVSMRRRMSDLNGSIDWQAEGEGCRVLIELPLAMPAGEPASVQA